MTATIERDWAAMLTAAEDPEQVAQRFGLPVEWARMHVGPHRCADGRQCRRPA